MKIYLSKGEAAQSINQNGTWEIEACFREWFDQGADRDYQREIVHGVNRNSAKFVGRPRETAVSDDHIFLTAAIFPMRPGSFPEGPDGPRVGPEFEVLARMDRK